MPIRKLVKFVEEVHIEGGKEADPPWTMMAVAATGQPHYQAIFQPIPIGFTHVDYDDVEAIQSVRLDFFKDHLKGQPASRPTSMDDFPAKAAEVDGIPWLPRLITKARAKLRGELPADLMYG